MQPKDFGELFSLFESSTEETLERLLSVASEHDYPAGRAIILEEVWGNAVYFIVSGWVKVRRSQGEQSLALSIMGQGDFFGEMAILDESPRSTDVVAISPVQLISIPAQRFIQTLFQDAQLHHRLLLLMVRRLRQMGQRLYLQHHSPVAKLVHMLAYLGEAYGQVSERGTDIFHFPLQDLADVSDVSLKDASQVMEKLESKGWIQVDEEAQRLSLVNLKQITHLAGQV